METLKKSIISLEISWKVMYCLVQLLGYTIVDILYSGECK